MRKVVSLALKMESLFRNLGKSFVMNRNNKGSRTEKKESIHNTCVRFVKC